MNTPSVHITPCSPWSSLIYISIEKRKAEAERIRQKYPDRIPVSHVAPFHALHITSPPGHLREGRQD